MKSDFPADDELDTLLRRNASLPPLADGDFSTQVVAALPPTQAARRVFPTRVRALWCIAGSMTGGILATVQLLRAENPEPRWPEAEAVITRLASQLNHPEMALAAATALFALWFAFRGERARRTLRH